MQQILCHGLWGPTICPCLPHDLISYQVPLVTLLQNAGPFSPFNQVKFVSISWSVCICCSLCLKCSFIPAIQVTGSNTWIPVQNCLFQEAYPSTIWGAIYHSTSHHLPYHDLPNPSEQLLMLDDLFICLCLAPSTKGKFHDNQNLVWLAQSHYSKKKKNWINAQELAFMKALWLKEMWWASMVSIQFNGSLNVSSFSNKYVHMYKQRELMAPQPYFNQLDSKCKCLLFLFLRFIYLLVR